MKLSPRQAEVMRHYMLGKTTKQVALDTGMSLSTVKTHTQSAFKRLEATNKVTAVLNALEAGVIHR